MPQYFFGVDYKQQVENKGVSKQNISQYGANALDRIRRNPEAMRSLAEFLPEHDFDPYRSTCMTAWTSSGLSVQEKYLSSLEKHSGGILDIGGQYEAGSAFERLFSVVRYR